LASQEISDIPGHPEKLVAGFTTGLLGEDHIKPRQKISGGIVTIARQFSQLQTALSQRYFASVSALAWFYYAFLQVQLAVRIASKARLL